MPRTRRPARWVVCGADPRPAEARSPALSCCRRWVPNRPPARARPASPSSHCPTRGLTFPWRGAVASAAPVPRPGLPRPGPPAPVFPARGSGPGPRAGSGPLARGLRPRPPSASGARGCAPSFGAAPRASGLPPRACNFSRVSRPPHLRRHASTCLFATRRVGHLTSFATPCAALQPSRRSRRRCRRARRGRSARPRP